VVTDVAIVPEFELSAHPVVALGRFKAFDIR